MADRSVEINLSSKRSPGDALVKAFAKAERRIDAVVYKFNMPKTFKALEKALGRGVALRLVVDSWLIDDEKNGFTRKLAEEKGAKVRKWIDAKLHVKLVIIDDRHVLTGSYNWTRAAKKKNTEFLLRFDDQEIGGAFGKLFEDMWKSADRL